MSKYELEKLAVGQHKRFKIEDMGRVKHSCHYYGVKLQRVFSIKKTSDETFIVKRKL